LAILLRLSAEPLENQQHLLLQTLLSGTLESLNEVFTATRHLDRIDGVYGQTLVLLESTVPDCSEMKAIVQNNWASSLLIRPDARGRNPRKAIELARLALELKSSDEAATWLVLGVALEQTGDLQGSDQAFRRVIELGCDKSDNTLNGSAWRLVTEPAFRTIRPRWAVQMAERAVKLPGAGDGPWNTLGVARYRASDWAGAIEALEESERLAPDKLVAWNGFFLAMAHWQLGDKQKASQWYNKSVHWMEKHQVRDEVIRFRAEAAALLDLPVPAAPAPKEVPRSAKG
jgi:Flp pilus assembly protein TadD